MAKLYERYLRVLKNWPLNPQYPLPTRRLPEYIRQQGKLSFSARGEFSGDAQKCDKHLKSLETITRNHWSHVYPRARQSGALGLTAEQCRIALSEEYQEALVTSRMTATFKGILSSLKRN